MSEREQVERLRNALTRVESDAAAATERLAAEIERLKAVLANDADAIRAALGCPDDADTFEMILALKADNAALVDLYAGQVVGWAGDRSWCRECRTEMAQTFGARRVPHQHAASCPLAQPHPGAALLKEKAQQAETIKALADALLNLLPPERGPGCWCHHSRAVDTAGHSPPCSIAREALCMAGRLP